MKSEGKAQTDGAREREAGDDRIEQPAILLHHRRRTPEERRHKQADACHEKRADPMFAIALRGVSHGRATRWIVGIYGRVIILVWHVAQATQSTQSRFLRGHLRRWSRERAWRDVGDRFFARMTRLRLGRWVVAR